jgi:RHS repeat-associated protein
VCGSLANAPAGVRQWTYTYCEQADITSGTCPNIIGLLKHVDGPRTDVADVVDYTYYTSLATTCGTFAGPCYRPGDLKQVTDALGHVTQYVTYDGAGRLVRMIDSNGTYIDMTYHPRGWLLARYVRANANGSVNLALDATTTFGYDAVGNVIRVTQPDNTYVAYAYDDAHRLTDIYDSATPSNYLLGNHIHYSLDMAGHRTDEQTFDLNNGALKREMQRNYDQLNHLLVAKNSAGLPVQTFKNPPDMPPGTYPTGYDSNGNAIYSEDGTLLHVGTEQQYDPLNRLMKTLQDHADTGPVGPTRDTATIYTYDARNNLLSVKDPDLIVTNYTYDGLNNLKSLSSHDSGNSSYIYDAAGNRLMQTDANLVTTSYVYDALNRLTSISYPTTSLNVTYVYDQPATGCYNVGRLTKITDSSGSTTYCYDQHGNVLSKIQITSGTTLATSYTYTLADRLASITYPSGAIVSYTPRNSIGQITNVVYKANATATPVTLVSSTAYLPFGPLNVLTFGNGRTLTKAYDKDYAIDQVVSSNTSPSPLVIDATVDYLGNLINASSTIAATPPTQQYQYDPLYRLTTVQTSSGASTFSYDLTGDRLSKTPQGQSAQSYTYTPSTHRLASVAGVGRSYDNNGNRTAVASSNQYVSSQSFTYDDRNRLSNTFLPTDSRCGTCPEIGVDFDYSGRGERVVKNVTTTFPNNEPTTTTTLYVYNERGQLLSDGGDYIYLDSTPIAYVSSGQIYYIETDQLGTPRQVIRPGATTTAADTLVWKWDYFANNSAFGENMPSVQTITFNLRFPGQYFDSETGLNYNYFRDYEAGTGRYVESDPVGLGAGINTYGYVSESPLRGVDPQGLAQVDPSCNCSPFGPDIASQVQLYCEISIYGQITDYVLRACVLKHCQSARIKCSDCADQGPTTLAYTVTKSIDGRFAGPTTNPPEVNLCNRIANLRALGPIFLHEAAHLCGWDHMGPTYGEGVPGANGETNQWGY